MIVLHTNFGEIKIELTHKETPTTVNNFLTYAREKQYDDTIFHRVIDNFMIQGGGFSSDMVQRKSDDAITNEAETALSNTRGTIAMARTSDPHSATSQFFINVTDNPFLDFKHKTPDEWGYCVFGRVVAGMDVVDQIKQVPTHSKAGHHDVPVEDVRIERVVLLEE